MEPSPSALGPYTFLLVGKAPEARWPMVLEQALAPLGHLYIVPEEEAVHAVSERAYDVVLIDAGAVQDVVRLMTHLRAQQPRLRIVVVTASPTWQQSREVFRAGAADYLRKSLDKKKLRDQIRAVLEMPPLPPYPMGQE
jgi:DNA-binding NarL/FixJ family response regulator